MRKYFSLTLYHTSWNFNIFVSWLLFLAQSRDIRLGCVNYFWQVFL